MTPPPLPPHWVALSIKQPWAALLVAGMKTVEVRTWPTRRRGWVLIHAARVPDDRPEAWEAFNTPELRAAAGLRGGIVGRANLVDCRVYESPTAFALDHPRHHNMTAWFRPPRLYGLVFQDIRPVPFYPYQGQTMFFGVEGFALKNRPICLVQPPEAPTRRKGQRRTPRGAVEENPD